MEEYMSTFYKAGLTSLLLVLSFAAQAQAPKQTKPADTKKYGALAVDRSNGFVYGFGNDHPTRQAANDRAMKECTKRKGQCAVVVEFSGEGCAAYATTPSNKGTAFGWATNRDMNYAKDKAREYCQGFSGGEACGNHVWACNAKGSGSFNVEHEEPLQLAKECYVQFEAQVDKNRKEDWAGRFYSPVYHLKAEDCPPTGPKNASIYGGGFVYYDGLPEYKAKDNAKNDASGRGQAMAKQFHDWLAPKPSPYANTVFRSVGSVTLTSVTPALLKELAERNSKLDSGISQKSLPGAVPTCLDFKLANLTPIAVLGTEGCQRWVR
jgi:hypothetical protein